MDRPRRFSGTESERAAITTLHDALIAQSWLKLGAQVSQARIRRVVTEVESRFRGATVTTFVPILMRRKSRERLAQDIKTDGVRA